MTCRKTQPTNFRRQHSLYQLSTLLSLPDTPNTVVVEFHFWSRHLLFCSLAVSATVHFYHRLATLYANSDSSHPGLCQQHFSDEEVASSNIRGHSPHSSSSHRPNISGRALFVGAGNPLIHSSALQFRYSIHVSFTKNLLHQNL